MPGPCKRSFLHSLNSNLETKLKSYELIPGGEITDCNDLPLNSIGYTYPEIIHSPSAGSHILTYGLRENHKVQIGLGANGYALCSRVCQNNVWSGWETYTRKSDLVNPYKTLLLAWGNYSDGTYALSESIFGRAISIAVGINGRLRGTWIPASTNDIRSIVIPGGGVIDVKILSATQVQITGTTADYRVREIFAI